MKRPRDRSVAGTRPDAPSVAAAAQPPWSTRLSAAIFSAALAARLFHVFQIRRAPFFDVLMGDARSYDAWAQRIAGGDWFGSDVFYQAPLYPYFLGVLYAAAGRDLLVVRLAQAVIGAASCVLLAQAAARLFSRTAGIGAGLFLALYAPAIFFDGLIQKSVLDVFFVCLALWLMSGIIATPNASSRWSWAALGAAMGGLALTRENAIVLVAVILLWAILRVDESPVTCRQPAALRWPAVGGFALGLAIVLAPVAVRNYVVGGGLYLTTSQFGPNFYIGNNPKADGTYMSLRFGRGAPEFERQDATDLAQLALGRTLSPDEVSGYWTDRALGFITSQPGAWLALLARKFRLLWNADEMLDTESQESYAEWSAPLRVGGWLGHFGVLVPLAVLGAWLCWPDRRRLWVFYVMALAYAASVLLFYVFARYRFPLVPFLILFASSGIASLAAAGSSVRRPALAAPAAIVAAVAVFTNWPVLPASLMKAITENNLATALQEHGILNQAAVHYQRSIALRADYAPAHNNLGVALRSQGRLDDAIASYQRALEVQPDYPDAHYNLANALLDKNRPADAAAHFRVALAAIPDSAATHNNLGIALAAEGKFEESITEFQAALKADPNSARTHRNLGNALSAVGRTGEGLTLLQRAVTLDPSDKEARYDLGSDLLELNRPSEAAAQFEAVLALDPAWAAAHNNLGIALASQGRLEEAIRHFQRALELQPGFADAQRNLALALDSRRARR